MISRWLAGYHQARGNLGDTGIGIQFHNKGRLANHCPCISARNRNEPAHWSTQRDSLSRAGRLACCRAAHCAAGVGLAHTLRAACPPHIGIPRPVPVHACSCPRGNSAALDKPETTVWHDCRVSDGWSCGHTFMHVQNDVGLCATCKQSTSCILVSCNRNPRGSGSGYR